MPSFKMIVEYDGTRFNGFQRQVSTSDLTTKTANKNSSSSRPDKRPKYNVEDGTRRKCVHTIQSVLEHAIADWAHVSVASLRMRSAGRTDKGVHARGQVVAIDLERQEGELSNISGSKESSTLCPPSTMGLWEMQRATNSRLPVDVVVRSFESCEASFEPRHEAKIKRYSYTMRYRRKVVDRDGIVLPICTSGVHTLRSTLNGPCVYVCPWALDDTCIVEICHSLTGAHDFAAFVHKEDRRKRDNTTTLLSFDVHTLSEMSSSGEQEKAPAVTVRFVLEARGFRRSMVRNLVGFVVDVCRGEIQQSEIPKVWTGEDEAASMVKAVPGCGLCLESVHY